MVKRSKEGSLDIGIFAPAGRSTSYWNENVCHNVSVFKWILFLHAQSVAVEWMVKINFHRFMVDWCGVNGVSVLCNRNDNDDGGRMCDKCDNKNKKKIKWITFVCLRRFEMIYFVTVRCVRVIPGGGRWSQAMRQMHITILIFWQCYKRNELLLRHKIDARGKNFF